MSHLFLWLKWLKQTYKQKCEATRTCRQKTRTTTKTGHLFFCVCVCVLCVTHSYVRVVTQPKTWGERGWGLKSPSAESLLGQQLLQERSSGRDRGRYRQAGRRSRECDIYPARGRGGRPVDLPPARWHSQPGKARNTQAMQQRLNAHTPTCGLLGYLSYIDRRLLAIDPSASGSDSDIMPYI